MTVVVTAPADGATVAGVIPVTAVLQTTLHFRTSYLLVDGAQVAQDSALPISFLLDTAKVKDGLHKLLVRCLLFRGRLKSTQEASVTVDILNTVPVPVEPPPPTVSVTAAVGYVG